jgi:hypothetical protein
LDTPKDPPSIFANRIIRQIADHLLGEDLIIEPKDFMILRLVYRRLGGTWDGLIHGNGKYLQILEKTITNWGKMPGRKRESPDA